MKQTQLIMGMPITVKVEETVVRGPDSSIPQSTSSLVTTRSGHSLDPLSLSPLTTTDFEEIFEFFRQVDKRFSTYKKNSEISLINQGKIKPKNYSSEMKKIFKLADKTKKQTDGFFNIEHNGMLDPSGIVKGWAIFEASKIIKKHGLKNFYIEAGGDIQAAGKEWLVGIKNPFNKKEIVKVLKIKNHGVATSGNYERGEHIYNPNAERISSSAYNPKGEIDLGIISLTVIGPNVLEADRFATAAFAMGKKGIYFIERLKGFEGYMIDKSGVATQTTGLERFLNA